MHFELICHGDDRGGVFRAPDGLVIALADGAGGTSHGGRAAQAVIDAVRIAAVEGATFDSAALLETLDATPSLLGGGQTTAVLASITADGIRGAAIGDSEAWLVGDDILDLTARQIRKPLLGDGALVIPFDGPALGTSTLVVASDGLVRYVARRRIAVLARLDDLAHAARTLVDEARRAKGPDDISIILCRA